MRWTDEEIELLCEEYARAISAEVLDLDRLAEMFGRHKTNVCRKARQLGLTKQSRQKKTERQPKPEPKFASDAERNAATGARIRQYIATHGHPRGAAGMKHSAETRKQIGEKSRACWADPRSRQNAPDVRQIRSNQMVRMIAAGKMRSGHTRARGGKRDDLGGIYFRSAWEANYARYLNWLQSRGEIVGWEYECKTFVFEKIKRGTRAYTPDFRVVLPSGAHEWHEVKGWMDDRSKTRLSRMARYYPAERIVVVDQAWFRQAAKGPLPGLIPHWESGSVR